MLKTLKFEVTFAHTGRTIKGDHSFSKGMSAITGPNESGKSLRLEMIRYTLFGTKALRSTADTYASIKSTLNLEINGEAYEIVRSPSSAKLKKDGVEIATGTKPVNGAIVRILGYDMEVFDVANAVLQGQVSALTDKTPAERRKMVDKTIGLNAVDDLIKEYGEQISVLNKTIAALEPSLNSGVGEEPIKPTNYQAAESLLEAMEAARADIAKLESMMTELTILQCEEPELNPRTVLETQDELLSKQVVRADLSGRLKSIKDEIQRSPTLDLLKLAADKELYQSYLDNKGYEKWAAYKEYQDKKVKLTPKVPLTKEDLENISKALEAAPIQQRIHKLSQSPKVTCPSCDTEFCLNHKELEAARSEQDWGDLDVPKYIDLGAKFNIIRPAQASLYIQALEEFEQFKLEPEVVAPEIINLGTKEEVELRLQTVERNLNTYKALQELNKQKVEIEEQLKDLPDYTDLINRRREEDQAAQNYSLALQKYELYIKRKEEYAPELERYLPAKAALSSLMELDQVCRKYDIELSSYNKMLEMINSTRQKIEALQLEKTKMANIRKALTELKPKVQSYLIPSLARVSSNYLAEMTNNQRNRIDITSEFEIMVDGQPVKTLSGSGEAVTNLALRIGLGTVLTNKVFSVLLADEIDASMDKTRAASTAECLRNLTKVVGQIILVSHQQPQADHYIQLT